jgi:hypothetical protein
LPNNAGDPINHAIEHSVENFDNLFVVWWIQNMKTKEVTQAGKTGDGVIISIPKVNSDANALAYIHDGFLNIHSAAPVENIELYNISGQKQILGTMIENTIPVHHLSSGVYVLKIKTAEGERNIKVIK